MAMTINTNVVSLNAQRNLGLSGGSLSTSMQRLSSGLRVNSAKDDAAGLAIAERMNAQSKGLAVAARNANDGISLAQTAEGALGKVGDMLQRMRELAVQASNATNSEADRKALQAEVGQLTSEIDRIAKTSSFNGQKILDGSFAGGVFQIGASAGDNITVGAITNAKASSLSSISYGERTFGSLDADTFKLTTTGTPAEDVFGYAVEVEAGDLQVNGIKLDGFAAASSAQERLGQVVAAINAKTADTGVTAFLEADANNPAQYQIRLMSEKLDANGDVQDVTLTGFHAQVTGLAGVGAGTAATATADAASTLAAIQTEFDAVKGTGGAAETQTVIDAGTAAADVDDAAATAAVKANQTGIDELSVTTQADAWKALKSIDNAIDQVNSARADLGALQTRFEKSIENIDIMNENISAARGRIVDADFATETANLSRAQILQQAGTAMVAQANQLPQQVLSLLQ
ncbi:MULTISPECIES: flagellin [Comamonas]|uniref:flagellin N-terminal helical domain-containing protein n=1 Tax=Comamonas TaxID=283 RepID=UPI0025795775|nr:MULTISPECIES: flagellin [Comamonas]